MYSLQDMLNTRGEDSVTSGPCGWRRKPLANVESCEVKHLIITKLAQLQKLREDLTNGYKKNILM